MTFTRQFDGCALKFDRSKKASLRWFIPKHLNTLNQEMQKINIKKKSFMDDVNRRFFFYFYENN